MLIEIPIFGYGINEGLFIFIVTSLSGFAWWLTAMYYNVKAIKTASEHRGKQLDLVIIKNEALTETLGTEGIEFGKKFKYEYDKNVANKIREYKIETI